MEWKIPLFRTYWEEDDIEAVSSVIRRGTYWATGPEIKEFEKTISNFIGKKYAVAFNSGTSALHALLLAHDIKGKEVIVPSFTFIATANTVLLAGGIPVFAESEPDTFSLDAEDVKNRITAKTRAILPISYGGFPPRDIEKLRQICDENNILLIEDAAESIGAHIDGKMIGSYGDSSMISFCQNKVLATGEGGIILTDSQELNEKARFIRSHGRIEAKEDYFSSTEDNEYIELGYNYRMPSMIAALGLSQFSKIDKIIEMRRRNATLLTERLSSIKQIRTPKLMRDHFQVYQMYTITLPDEKTRNALQEHLKKEGIMTKVYFNPVHLKAIYKNRCGFKEGDLPVTESLSKRVLSLPIYPSIKNEEINYITRNIEGFFNHERY